jgi:hypothetical protein
MHIKQLILAELERQAWAAGDFFPAAAAATASADR